VAPPHRSDNVDHRALIMIKRLHHGEDDAGAALAGRDVLGRVLADLAKPPGIEEPDDGRASGKSNARAVLVQALNPEPTSASAHPVSVRTIDDLPD
jgi:hypothetical protein